MAKSILIESILQYKISMALFTLGSARFENYFIPYLKNMQDFSKYVDILDLGCGDGTNISKLKKKLNNPGNRYCGIDLSQKLINKATRVYPDITFECKDICEIDTATWDIVISTFVFHHFPLEMKKTVIHEVKRVLKPNGIFLYTDFGKPTTKYAKIFMGFMKAVAKIFPSCYECISSQMNNEVINLLIDQGFEVELIKESTVPTSGRIRCVLAKVKK